MKDGSGVVNKPKIILGIETSCDETSVAVVQKTDKGTQILSNTIASSAELQAKYGGVIPEQAAREQLSSIIPVLIEALNKAQITKDEIDAIAVTQGPGLIGSLLVGVETAKVLSLIWEKPLIPVNHLLGHFYANWISNSVIASEAKQSLTDHPVGWIQNEIALSKTPRNDKFHIPKFPLIGLLVSGGHTDLIYMTDHGKYQHLGGTRDDAAGEAFDKTARLLDLPYPGGPVIAKLAEQGNPKAFNIPRPMMKNFLSKGQPSFGWDFSFSGLKTAVGNLVRELGDKTKDKQVLSDLCASIQEAIVDVLVKKTVAAAQRYNVEQVIVAGGVAANQKLTEKLIAKAQTEIPRAVVLIPPPKLCTDNAAYIATAAFYNYYPVDPLKLQADPSISLS